MSGQPQLDYPAGRKAIIAFAGIAGSVAMVLSATIANVAIPSVMGAFGVGQDQAQWAATAFIATMVVSQLLSAWFSTALGMRLAFLILNATFLVGALICVVTPNLDVLIFGRVLQGFAAGSVQPMVMVLIFRLFPAEQRGFAMGLYSMGIMIAPTLGPMVGGFVIDALSWREVFLVPVPVCLLSMLLGLMFLPAGGGSARWPGFDWLSFALLCASIFMLLAAGANGQRWGWLSDTLVTIATLGLLSGVLFVWRQLVSSAPILDMSLFRIPQFAAAVFLALVFGFGNFASSYLMPVYVQEVQGFPPSLAGTMLVPAGLLMMVGSPLFGRLTDSYPGHLMVMLGLILFSLGNWLLSETDVNTSFLTFVLLVCLARSGMSLINPALSAAALGALTAEQLTRGSGTINFCRQFGGAVGITSIVVFMERRTQFHGDALAATQTADNVASAELLERVRSLMGEGGVVEPQRAAAALHYLGQVVEAQATTMGFKDGFMALVVVFVLALFPAWLLGAVRRRSAGQAGRVSTRR
ncbi:MAG: DHA2 family efflux MFS transporter permease subunit [Gammaproteobacteria bacterium]|nr:DHA2 family efflux MFS transporter permease subunit [Gammaproteobacteria bacterium]